MNRHYFGLLLTLMLLPGMLLAAAPAAKNTDEHAELREWINAMKGWQRGPFARIRWFCADGTILPPKPYACRPHGGGRQHGEWSDKTQVIRAQGFMIANVLAAVKPEDVLPYGNKLLQLLLLEQFLITVDDGWILRQARYYGGAFQAEDEAASATAILQALLLDDTWLEHRLLLIVEAARLLPHGVASSELTRLRADAASLEDADPGFEPLRNKIHGRPDISDAATVREYARTRGKPELAQAYEALAVAIETEADPARIRTRLMQLSRRTTSRVLQAEIRAVTEKLETASDPLQRIEITGFAVEQFRQLLPTLASGSDRLVAVDVMIALGESGFVDSQMMRAQLATVSRLTQLQWMVHLARIAYGTADLSDYEWRQLKTTARAIDSEIVDLEVYRHTLNAMARAPSWVQRRHALHMETSIAHLAQIEPLVREYIPDRLRSSPMLMYALILESLTADANQLAGVKHSFFGRSVASGLRSLNPGAASGILLTEEDYERNSRPGVSKVLVVPETLADLPPVEGILTENEGNHLSHVQLLARNLGIPNVVIGPGLRSQLDTYRGKPVSLLSTPGGIVQLHAMSDEAFAASRATRESSPAGRIEVDLKKLNLNANQVTPISGLRAGDSGVRVGPKAAKLGELMYRYPDAVSAALAIPFGAFRDVLDQPFDAASELSAFDWLRSQYAALDAIADPELRVVRRNAMLASIRQWFLEVELDPAFVEMLKVRMREAFGRDGSYGVFVRSDTNVEDLPGFTGAGLNLTVPNVVGFDNTLQAIRRVWASPFSERAYGWRQALMDKPEHLYAAVLLHKSVNADVSGVMVTQNVDTGASDEITVVTNEGVGGGVEGQSAETLVVHTATGNVELISSATAPLKRVLLDAGGSELVDTSGAERLLSDANIAELLKLVADIERWFETDADGQRLAADVEFGFDDDRLVLFQIRPFVENRSASANSRLIEIDAPLRALEGKRVDLTQPIGP